VSVHLGADVLEARIAELRDDIARSGGWSSGGYTTPAAICDLLGCSMRTWRDWRARGTAPPVFRAHRDLVALSDLAEWLSARKVTGGKRRIAADAGGS